MKFFWWHNNNNIILLYIKQQSIQQQARSEIVITCYYSADKNTSIDRVLMRTFKRGVLLDLVPSSHARSLLSPRPT